MASPFTVFAGTDKTTLTHSLLAPNSGITIVTSSIVLNASGQDAVNFYDGTLAPLGIGAGLLLTSGTTPGTANTVGWFGNDNSWQSGFNNGDADINAVVNTVFQTQSYDATSLSFDFSVADTTATSVSFDLVFGSDEYPEWVDQFVDSAIVMVNGVNYALFNHDPNHPLSVVTANLAAGYFQNNAGGILPIEYDGVSHVLKIVAPINAGGVINHIKIGIADTGDHIYDSGIFIANLTAGNIPGSGVVITPPNSGTDNSDNLTGSSKDEYFDLKNGDDVVYAGAGDDIVVAGAGNDSVYGGSGADEMKGDAGDDSLDGGDGIDTAVYTGSSADFVIAFDNANGKYTISAKPAGLSVDGTDTLAGVEFAKFSDSLLSLGVTGLVSPVVTPDPVVTPANQPGIVFINGIGGQGQKLTASVSDSDGVPTAGVSYAWQADGVALGVSGDSFVVGAAQVGKNITVTASYTDLASHAEYLTSAVKYISAPGNGDFAITLLNLSAPIGASVMNPLTTLVQNAIGLGVSPNEAGIIIKSVLGISATVDIEHYDAWAALQVNPGDQTAMMVEKKAVQVAVMTSLGSDETGMALTQAILLAHSNNTILDLTDTGVIAGLLGLDPANPLVQEIWDRNDTIGAADTVDAINKIWLDIQSGLDVILSDSIATLSIHINQAPTGTATAGLPEGAEGSAYLLSASDLLVGFSDSDGGVLSVSGLSANIAGSLVDNKDGTWTFTPDASYSGPVELSYAVIDGQGGSAPASQLFVIAPAPVVPVNTAPSGAATAVLAAGSEDTAYVINAGELLQGFSDVDGDTLAIDGLTADNGSLLDNNNGSWIFTPNANYNGPVNLVYNVIDGQGGLLVAGQSFNLAAVNDAPVGAATAVLAAGSEDTAYVINAGELLQGFSDVDGDTLAIDGLTADNGSLLDNNNGSWTFTPNADYNGPVSLSYNVIDGQGGLLVAGQNFNLAAVNDAPVGAATAVLAAGSEDTAYVINASELLQGFSDVDGDTLAINGLTADNGNLLNNNNGSWTFTPNADYNGPVNLVYNVIDGQGGLLVAGQNFNLAAINDASVGAVNITGLPVEGQILSADAGTVQDADGLGAFSYQWQSNGQAVAGAIGSSYLLGAGDVGKTISVSVSYTDGGNTMESLVSPETSAVSAQIQQDAPVANNDSIVTPEEKPVKVNAVANDTDANNDMLAISAFDATSVNGGNIVLNADGSFTYTPAHDFSGTDSFSYRVSDGSAESNTATVSVTVLDDAPVESRVSITLSDSEINLALKGKAHISGTGNAWDNNLAGNKGDNVLNGKGGNDYLNGDEGKDVLIGGIGNDVLKGGDGKDSYLYAGEAIQAGGKDKILDGQGDVIDLKALLSSVKVDGVNLESIVQNISLGNAFSNVAGHETTLAFNGDGGKLLFDINQDGKFTAGDDFQITITGVEKVVFNAGADLMLLV